MLILNDTHLGVNRVAGTTAKSGQALRKFMFTQFERLVASAKGELLIAGDLFDTFNPSLQDILDTLKILEKQLIEGQTVIVMAGNHDVSKDTSKLSGLDFMSEILSRYSNFKYVKEPMKYKNLYLIPHLVDQAVFNQALLDVPECALLVLHCNYDNKFAVQSDHSLNITKEQVALTKAAKVYIAHEHAGRSIGKVLVGGNQIPSSIADCLGGPKSAYSFTNGKFSNVEVWSGAFYAEVDWRSDTIPAVDFIRVTGAASAEEAAAVSEAVIKIRNKSSAYIVSNAVEVCGVDGLQNLEAIQAFDLLTSLKTWLTEAEIAVLKGLQC